MKTVCRREIQHPPLFLLPAATGLCFKGTEPAGLLEIQTT